MAKKKAEIILSSKMEEVLAKISKDFGKDAIIVGNRSNPIPRSSTGCLTLDLITGGGWGVGKIVEVFGPESSGKALSMDAKILTPTGWIENKDAKVGMEVLTPKGEITTITGVFPQGKKLLYKVKFDDETSVKACGEHLWKVHQYNVGEKVISTQEILDIGLENEDEGCNFSIPPVAAKEGSLNKKLREFLTGEFEDDEFTFKTLNEEEFLYAVDSFRRNGFKVTTTKNSFTFKACLAPKQIVSITPVGEEECQCISVGHPDKLYITNDYIVTHNTTFSIHSMAEVQKTQPNKYIAIIDAEHALDSKYCEALGLDMSKVLICQPDFAEQGLDIALTLLESGEVSFILIDSLAALVPKATLEGDMEDMHMALEARMISKFLKKATGLANKNGTILYLVNQLRQKIGGYGVGEVTTGGNAPKFYASIRVEFRKHQGDLVDKQQVNSKVHIKIVKNKLSPPFQVGDVYINFGTGVDKVRDVFDTGIKTGVIAVNGRTYSYKETKLGVGKDVALQILRDNPELVDIMYQEILEQVKAVVAPTQYAEEEVDLQQEELEDEDFTKIK
jgi:recombination protein RecA